MKWITILFNNVDWLYDYFGHYFVKTILIFHVTYIAVILGIVSLNLDYLNTFNIFVHSLVCIFLILRFNPLREKNHLREHDSEIIFSSSLFLLINMGIVEGIKKFLPNYHENVKELRHLL